MDQLVRIQAWGAAHLEVNALLEEGVLPQTDVPRVPVWLEQGRFEEALRELDEVGRGDPMLLDDYRGIALAGLGAPADLHAMTDEARAWAEGLIAKRAGDPEGVVRAAAKQIGERPWVRREAAEALLSLGRPGDAARVWEILVLGDYCRVPEHLELGIRIHRALGDTQTAEALEGMMSETEQTVATGV